MEPLTAEGSATLQETVRQVRAIPQLREKQKGTYELLGQAFVVFGEVDGTLHADLRKVSGTGIERFALADAATRRKFVDEAKRRAAKLTDE